MIVSYIRSTAWMGFLRQWWTEPVPTGWLRAFLHARKLDRTVRNLIGGYALIFAAICVAVQFSDTGPRSTSGRIIVGVCALGALGWAVRWVVGPWPSLREAVGFVVFADVGIAIACWQDSDPLAGLVGTVLFTPVGAYVSFFLGNRLLVAHVAWCAPMILALSSRLLAAGTVGAAMTAVVKMTSMLLVVVLIPAVIQFGIAVVRLDALAAQRDPLTGLLNRRGIYGEWQRLHNGLTGDRILEGDRVIAVAIVDIDRFKSINDRYGHGTGDRVLVGLAGALTAETAQGNLVGRSGGEEFLVVTICPAGSVTEFATRLKEAVTASMPAGIAVTASVGVAAEPVASVALATSQEAIDALTACADRAMYEAKRGGGNQSRILHPGVGVDDQCVWRAGI
ncbi:GGDEF domain-containing protein [Mycobacteroides franklinii]|uniref:Putative diguanylate cyclase YdaM n=1 Tax=Mycobacteroides franklinii TaxID=948102 RepID=A0A4R8R408_9MYCO|nr:GGDEF domain-containing protein [Mycobacteroides franklinii]TDZ43559.1 putative diguanylate cyclase YdaM [Mycobacteroides franklinii]TDZ50694.1 putative diguanylate cyclase YdaM [Mycobacteroides franklinii]TDZ57114.1 putative diguanylate cyclase YdaM [Mycobacteroides franklinii]TDZ64055.1 putative diguanylate cyclase YdaM [Mycobacteroides franklinii]TDZ70452.1 putative diguanylate cyclase YdaM [Mycobacteroides franklinii]